MFKIMEGVPRGELAERAGAMVRNMDDTLNVMNLRPPCLRMLGWVKHQDGAFVAEPCAEGVGPAEPTRHGTAEAAIRRLVRLDKAS